MSSLPGDRAAPGASPDCDLRVLALTRYGRLGASSRLRTIQYREPLERHGISLHLAPLFGDDYVRALYGRRGRAMLGLGALARRVGVLLGAGSYDAIWLEKELLPWLPAFAELALLPAGLPVIADYDDAVFHRYDRHRLAAVRALLGRKLDRVMARADLVVAGNDYLADRARRAGARWVEVVPTVVDLDRYPVLQRPPSAAVTVGWIGSPSTASYLDIVKPVVEDLARRIDLRAVAIGARPDQVAGSPFVAVPWSEEGEVEALRSFDIGIMPLADTPWERGKCGYKLIQYMALGMPVVASPVGVNTRIVQHGRSGFLASDADQWREALTALASDPDRRRLFGRAGRKAVEDEYALSVQAPRLASFIRRAAAPR